MRLLITTTLLVIYLTGSAQAPPIKNESGFRVDTSFARDGKKEKTLPDYAYKWVHTEVRYINSKRKGIIIQNSFPRGGPYTQPGGKRFGYGIFWTRVIN